ncbi:double-strand break repair protein AddB [Afipia massiliensis]|uniref:Double-strand break repair protein AddB n=1 Tax=Afipia massiliensis TaxID=211460 RepID=A0A4U6BMM2_9BRAD|nr:double-strand break repair protein AddB [Afipia massiliensis]TKT71111.1 double-strand break repair protein AddB [Afipia massiliensis]
MRVFNVPPSAPFLHTVISALVDGRLVAGFDARANPERLADATLYLPTRRAGRMAREVFLDVLQTDAVVLPRIVALGSVDEDELEFSDDGQLGGPEASVLPPKLDDLERRLTLARLVAAWANLQPASLVVGSPASTLSLASDLARLMDDMVTRGVGWDALDGIVPDELDIYWQHTLKFLKIAKETWPAYLAQLERIEPAARRDMLIAAEAKRLAANQRGPVIAAGSTGSMPATAKFLQAIAQLPQGAVVLPGLDTDLDAAAWDSIGGAVNAGDILATPAAWSHPQFALHGLLARFGIKRRDVEPLAAPSAHGREVLTSETMRPATSSEKWHTQLADKAIAQRIATGTEGLALIEAANPEMEALAIAVAMREAREHNLTAALVTPDRALARRVMASLGRWNLAFDDSGGDSLMDTSAGIFARLAAQTIAEELAPPSLLALLKHPLFRLGQTQGAFTKAIGDLELALLRGTRPAAGSEGLARDFARFRTELGKLRRKEPSAIHRSEPRAQLDAASLDAVQALITDLAAAFKPLEDLRPGKPHDLIDYAAHHYEVLKRLSGDDKGVALAFEDSDGSALSKAFDDLFQACGVSADDKPAPSGLTLAPRDYPDVFQTAFGDRIVRRPQSVASLRIYGPLEARLTECDRVILGGLVEGVWPPAPRVDPWLSRPMRHQLGLDLPERRIGLSAHDFAQLLGTRDVILSRAAKVGGAPAVASRFLHRMEAVAGKDLWARVKDKGDTYVRYANELDRPDNVAPMPRPEPKPDVALRPLSMSVTEIEDWLRDPYTIYAKRILKLTPLDPVDMPLTAADRGSAIHEALGEFTARFANALPDDVAAALREIGSTHFAPLMERPEARALWWPRFLRIADWFAGWEARRRSDVIRVDAEIRGEIPIRLDNGRTFRLSARADRIEHRTGNSYAILDYKTGQPPSAKQVRLGLSPQLTLEAAILRRGGFDNIPASASVGELVYVRLSGNNPPGKATVLELKLNKSDTPQPPDEAADEALQKLEGLIREFENQDTPYRSVVLPMWENRYGNYDNLARIKEWSAGGMGDDEE